MTKTEQIKRLHEEARRLGWTVLFDSEQTTIYRSPVNILDQIVIPKREDMDGIEVCLEAAARKLDNFF